MTNRNMHLNTNNNQKPFLLKPCGKDYLWGGNRLNDDFAKGIYLYRLILLNSEYTDRRSF